MGVKFSLVLAWSHAIFVFKYFCKVTIVAVTDACRNTADWKIRPHQLLSKKHKYLKKAGGKPPASIPERVLYSATFSF